MPVQHNHAVPYGATQNFFDPYQQPQQQQQQQPQQNPHHYVGIPQQAHQSNTNNLFFAPHGQQPFQPNELLKNEMVSTWSWMLVFMACGAYMLFMLSFVFESQNKNGIGGDEIFNVFTMWNVPEVHLSHFTHHDIREYVLDIVTAEKNGHRYDRHTDYHFKEPMRQHADHFIPVLPQMPFVLFQLALTIICTFPMKRWAASGDPFQRSSNIGLAAFSYFICCGFMKTNPKMSELHLRTKFNFYISSSL